MAAATKSASIVAAAGFNVTRKRWCERGADAEHLPGVAAETLEAMTQAEQLRMWVDGDPVHNDETGECCPDFSCCKPELLAPEQEREKFAAATEDQRELMLVMFLGRALGSAGVEAHIAGAYDTGDPANYQPTQ